MTRSSRCVVICGIKLKRELKLKKIFYDTGTSPRQIFPANSEAPPDLAPVCLSVLDPLILHLHLGRIETPNAPVDFNSRL